MTNETSRRFTIRDQYEAQKDSLALAAKYDEWSQVIALAKTLKATEKLGSRLGWDADYTQARTGSTAVA